MSYHSFEELCNYLEIENTRKWLMQLATSSSYLDRILAASHPCSTEEIQLTVKAKRWVDSYEYCKFLIPIENDY